jgi:hypothetical protein
MRRSLRILLAVVAGLVVWLFVTLIWNTAQLSLLNGDFAQGLYAITALGAGAAAAWALGRRRSPQPISASLRVPKWVVGLLVGGYVLTTLLGVPAVQTQQTKDLVKRWNEARLAGSDVHEAPPEVHYYLALPMAPGVIAVRQFVLGGPIASWDGWTFHVWYGFGSIRFYEFGLGGA